MTYNKDEPISVIYHMHLGWKNVKEMGIFDFTVSEQIKCFLLSAKPSMKVKTDAVHEVTFLIAGSQD